jgi:hypothetical protein
LSFVKAGPAGGGGGGGGGAELGDSLGLALGVSLGVSLGLALGVSPVLAEGLTSAAGLADGAPMPRENSRVRSTTTAISRIPPRIDRTTMSVFDLLSPPGLAAGVGASKRSVGVSSLMSPHNVR